MTDTRAAHQYILGADDSEHARLLVQWEIYRSQAERLLKHLGVSSGQRVLDVGYGPLGVLDLLSARVGPTGEVVGLDNEPRMIKFAERTIAEHGLTNVTLVHRDAASTGLPADYFDLAHERLLLINVPAPQDVVTEMVRVVRPGGWIAVGNVDMTAWSCEPAHPAWTVLFEALIAAWKAAGLDPFIGRRLPALLRDAGLTEISLDAQARIWRSSDPYHWLLLTFIGIFRNRIINGRFLTADQLDRLAAELQEHLAQPETFVIYSLSFQAWGRKPA
ncbi:MAG: methyltransferase domain-containing protein [Pseudonocardiales bacterium]|nr:methyltransferase domain-containing protein [Pseudonocardiales bacterium]